MDKDPETTKHRRRVLGALATGAGGAALVASLGSGDGAPPEEQAQLPAQIPPASEQIVSVAPRMPADSITVKATPKDACKPDEQQQLFAETKKLWQTHMQEGDLYPVVALQSILRNLTGKNDISKATIALVTDEEFTQLGTNRQTFTDTYKRESLAAAEDVFAHLFPVPVESRMFEENYTLLKRVRKAKQLLGDSIYPTPEAAAQAIIINGQPLTLDKINGLEQKYEDVMLAAQKEGLETLLAEMKGSEVKPRTSRLLRHRLTETAKILDDGKRSAQEQDAAFLALTGHPRSEFVDFIKRHAPDSPYFDPPEPKSKLLKAVAFPKSQCWTERADAQSESLPKVQR